MKARGRKKNILKNIGTLVIVFVLICCSFSALNITTISTAKQNNSPNKTLSKCSGYQPSSSGEFLLLDENFTDGNMPPEGDSGDWTLQQTNPSETWYIDSTVPYTKPYCGTIHREESQSLQDEWLITNGPGRRKGGHGMKKIEAYIRHEAFEPIRMDLLDLGFPSLTISEVKGSGRQKGIVETYRGAVLTNYLRPKVKLECVVADGDVQTIVDTILKHGRTGAVGDGKVFVLPVEEAWRVRTGESGEEVLQAHPDAAATAA